MRPPPELKIESQTGLKMVHKLDKSLHGINQAPRSWQNLLASWLISYGFSESKVEPSLHTLIHNGNLYTLVVYFDDYLLFRRRCKSASSFKHDFLSRFKIDDLGLVTWILGCSTILDRSRGTSSLISSNKVYSRSIRLVWHERLCICVYTYVS